MRSSRAPPAGYDDPAPAREASMPTAKPPQKPHPKQKDESARIALRIIGALVVIGVVGWFLSQILTGKDRPPALRVTEAEVKAPPPPPPQEKVALKPRPIRL